MRIAPEWRSQNFRYLGKGSNAFDWEVGEQSLTVESILKGRKIELNHRGEDGVKGFVEGMKRWGFTKEITAAVGGNIASQMNGRAASFLEETLEEIERVYE